MTMLKPIPGAAQAAVPVSEPPASFLDDLEHERARRERHGRMPSAPGAAPYPALQVARSQDRILVHAEVPGLTWRDLRVNLHRTELVLEGERRPDTGAELDVVRREGAYGRFCRCLPLEVEVEPREMRVRLRDGILCLEVPIAAAVVPGAAVS